MLDLLIILLLPLCSIFVVIGWFLLLLKLFPYIILGSIVGVGDLCSEGKFVFIKRLNLVFRGGREV